MIPPLIDLIPRGRKSSESATIITPTVPHNPVGIVRKAHSNPKLITSEGIAIGNIPTASNKFLPLTRVLLATNTTANESSEMIVAAANAEKMLFIKAVYSPDELEMMNA